MFYLLSVLVCIPPDAGALRISMGDDVARRLINVIICGCRTRNTDQHENIRNTDQHENTRNTDQHENTRNTDQHENTRNTDQQENTNTRLT